MHRFLIVYNMVPDYLEIFKFETDDDSVAARIRALHGVYGNTEGADGDECNWLSDQLKNPLYDERNNRVGTVELDGQWELIVTGFMM